MLRRFTLILLTLLFGASLISAQADGQFCVQAYEDRNANGVRDVGEPFLQGGVSANLINESGVIVASALLDDAPNETRVTGVICFQFLAPGQYSMEVTAAEYRATTPNTLTVTLNEGDLPAVLEFGAQSLTTSAIVTTTPDDADPEAGILRVVMAAIGALVALVIMAIIGLFIYLVAFRSPRQPAPQPPVDDRYRRPDPTDTGTYR